MVEKFVVPVGQFGPGGRALKTVELDGERIAEGDQTKELASGASSTLIAVHWTLYRTTGARSLALHTLLRPRKGGMPFVATLERFASPTELSARHPSLAVAGAYAASPAPTRPPWKDLPRPGPESAPPE
ncbi:MAG: hypothetical protein KGJ23_04685 [Euryarchaeota archaeon]|nr:hypothetical protein [Euryarchaeota archaeon]MDE1835895.1 hypothetical protein [Euryarchaeota archaeon]MDE1880230.1 hypothetical protein [Euryarchaeota archaeon]MDE2044427.1 hypothetical protein [Thermoplasmata archaeon]